MKKDSRTCRKGFPLKKRFQYWFDNRMTRGSLGLIRILIIASILIAVLMGIVIIVCGFSDEGEGGAVIWDSIATVINAWMPSFEDGSPGYLIVMSVTAIAGVLFTSVLIGIITSAIEEKIDSLKRGNSLVLEEGHIVVLGFYPGEYTLLQQLILAAADEPACVVVAEDMDRAEMEDNIRENLDVPKNFRIVCRTADITDPASLEKCSVETCRTVIVSPTDDVTTMKAVLAVSALLEEKGAPQIAVNAIISRNEYRFPPSLAEANNISTLQTNVILAKMIAHSCTQTGLSETFREIFNFEGSEFYLIGADEAAGLSFETLSLRLENAVPVGIGRDGRVLMAPPADTVIEASDKLLVFSERSDSARLGAEAPALPDGPSLSANAAEAPTEAVIIGSNEMLPVILAELPENVTRVFLVSPLYEDGVPKKAAAAALARGIKIEAIAEDPHTEETLDRLARLAGHIVILGDHEKEPEEADMEAVFLLLNLRDIRVRSGLDFNITVEMHLEHSQKLAGRGDRTDFLVSSSMSSLIVAQLAESPELIGVFREILSNRGNELYLKNAGLLGLAGQHTVRGLRRAMLRHGYILMGHLDPEKQSRFDLGLDETLTLTDEDCLIVLGEK